LKEPRRDPDGWFAQEEDRVFLTDGRQPLDPRHLRERAEVVARLARLAGSSIPADGLASLSALRYQTERLELYAIANARSMGWSWRSIADSLGVSKQSLHRRYARMFPRPRRQRPRGAINRARRLSRSGGRAS